MCILRKLSVVDVGCTLHATSTANAERLFILIYAVCRYRSIEESNEMAKYTTETLLVVWNAAARHVWNSTGNTSTRFGLRFYSYIGAEPTTQANAWDIWRGDATCLVKIERLQLVYFEASNRKFGFLVFGLVNSYHFILHKMNSKNNEARAANANDGLFNHFQNGRSTANLNRCQKARMQQTKTIL